MTQDIVGFDLSAAYVRKAQGDSRAFMEGLAARLEPALPGRVEVVRRRDGLFSKTSHVASLTVALDRFILALALEHGRFVARRSKVVRGVTLSSEEIAVPVWLDALAREIGQAGSDAEAAATVLHDFLMS